MTHRRREAAFVLVAVLASVTVTFGVLRLRAEPARPSLSMTRTPLAATDPAARCESCHPRQAAEWRRSVMAYAVSSPLFQSLELLIEEQVGRSSRCPEGAGILRRRTPGEDCLDARSSVSVTGAGGEGWCVNCHAPAVNLGGRVPSWNAAARGADNQSLGELLGLAARDGIGCTFCHEVSGPVHADASQRGEYAGNPTWLSLVTGAPFSARVSANERRFGIANSGYRLDARVLLGAEPERERVAGGAHATTPPGARAYLRSSEFCGTCHDVRLFGTDVLGRERGEHFKRLRNGYSEWLDYARSRQARGLEAPTCQGCHLSTYPGICVADAEGAAPSRGCPPGTRFEPRAPFALSRGFASAMGEIERPLHPHYFSGVEVPLAPAFALELAGEAELDSAGLPLGVRARRELLLAKSVRLALGPVVRRGAATEIPVTVENVGAGHRVPGGFSQERELWVELTVEDGAGRVVYTAGHVGAPDRDLSDKRFLRVNTDPSSTDADGKPLGLFGADVSDGPDAPRWEPPPELGGTRFRGRGLVSFQNGFLRCVRCVGRVSEDGSCEPLPEQRGVRSARYADGDYDSDTGACASNLTGRAALFETYFPVGALDASRGVLKAPDAIIDTRSLLPDTPVTYTYVLPLAAVRLHVTARLLFRAFPPYLLRAFADYEAARAARGARPNGPLVTPSALERLDIVELARVEASSG